MLLIVRSTEQFAQSLAHRAAHISLIDEQLTNVNYYLANNRQKLNHCKLYVYSKLDTYSEV